MATTSSGSAVRALGGGPPRQWWVLGSLILVSSVANLNLAVANVALPEIGIRFDASQTELNLVSVGFSLGLAGTVLYLGALGDRYGRKGMLLAGMALTIPTALLATWAPTIWILFLARLLGGVAAGMAYPTTLALITALWDGPGRTRSIALWSAVGGSMVAIASVLAGVLLTYYWWGSVFAVTAPLAAIALFFAAINVPAHVNETDDAVDHLGGALSIVGVIGLVMVINFAPTSGDGTIALLSGLVTVVGLGGFFFRQTRARQPLFDLHVASRRTFWVAALAGLIVFGTLLGGIFVGEQFLQNVLRYSTLKAGIAALPAAFAMIIAAPQSAKLIRRFGSRLTLLTGYAFLLVAFLVMLYFWKASSGSGPVVVAMVFLGIGVGLSGTPASHSLTGSVPIRRAGMASGTADLQRDLGGSIMQSILGAILTAGYASAVARQIAASHIQLNEKVTTILERSFASAASFAKGEPYYRTQIIAGAQASFLHGARSAYGAGALAILLGAILVGVSFPKKGREEELLVQYQREDGAAEVQRAATTR
jgi:MFS transporter, DHA2 family, multidrug resistance protein